MSGLREADGTGARAHASHGAFAAGTIVSSDYLPWARVLAGSFRACHPDARFTVVVLDEPDPVSLRDDDPFELVRPSDIGLEGTEYAWMSTIYDPFELSCAVKPWLLRFLLADHAAAIYLDSDILVCDSLAGIAERAAEVGLVLSPHMLEPLPLDGLLPDEDTFLKSGVFNGGFVAVGRGGAPFLDWWAERLKRECLDWTSDDPLRFVDQRWLDLATNYFPLEVLRDRGANVAYWNLATRQLEREPDGYSVDGEPLRFAHFSGFDPRVPDKLSKHEGEVPRVVMQRSPALLDLCADYTDRLFAAGLGREHASRPAPVLHGKIVLTRPIRRALRAALVDAEGSDGARLPDPRAPEALESWLRAAVTAGRTSRYLRGLWASQPSVRQAFPQIDGADESRFLAWSAREGVAMGLVPPGLGGPAVAVELDGARRFVALVEASEILEDPALIADARGLFRSTDDVTFLIRASGWDADAFGRELAALLAELGLDGPESPDMLGFLEPASIRALAPLVHGVLTRRPVVPALASLPRTTSAKALRNVVDAALMSSLQPAASSAGA